MDLDKIRALMRRRDHMWLDASSATWASIYRDLADEVPGLVAEVERLRTGSDRWTKLAATSRSGKTLFSCSSCGRVSPTPDKSCESSRSEFWASPWATDHLPCGAKPVARGEGVSNPTCPNGCGELAIDGNRLVCTECGATPGFVAHEVPAVTLFDELRKIINQGPKPPVVIESTPYPGETGLLDRIASGTLSETSMGCYVPPPWTTADCPACSHDSVDLRCSGCGETPCIPDSRGCCPNRPDEELDLSWGDYETEEET